MIVDLSYNTQGKIAYGENSVLLLWVFFFFTKFNE